jgi:hypothetical protein
MTPTQPAATPTERALPPDFLTRPSGQGNQFGPPRSVADRFWEKVDKSGDCWEWTATIDKSGYGIVGMRPKNLKASRVAWMLTNGAIPDGLWVLHHCDNRRCVRPDHLFLGTNTDNQRDSVAKGRWRATHQRLVSGEARWPK